MPTPHTYAVASLLATLSLMASCASPSRGPAAERPLTLEGAFADAPGCMLLLNLDTGESWSQGGALCDSPRPPYSTFKIPHALIGLQTGELTGPDHLERYDGSPMLFAGWARDHTLATAISASVLWYFQRLAHRIGQETLHKHLKDMDYGNADTSSGVDSFWLEGSLEIDARGQLAFVTALEREALPIDLSHQHTIKELWTQPGYGAAFSGKTGSGYDSARGVFTLGWFIGTARGPHGTIAFAAWREGDGWLGPRVRDDVRALLIRRGDLVDAPDTP